MANNAIAVTEMSTSTSSSQKLNPLDPRAPGAQLHKAIEGNDWPTCSLILTEFGAEAGAAKNRCGTTPLMLAANGKCGKNNGRLIDALLVEGAGGAASAAERNRFGKTAADIAEASGFHSLSSKLRLLEPLAMVKETKFTRCPHCFMKVKLRSKLEFVEDRIRRREETNPLLCHLFNQNENRDTSSSSPSVIDELKRVEYHRINNCLELRKELTESLSLISALKENLRPKSSDPDHHFPSSSIENDNPDPLSFHNVHIIDLCAGSSITTALLLNLLPGSFVTAVDLVQPNTLPHFDQLNFANRFSYICKDIFDHTIVDDLANRVSETLPNHQKNKRGENEIQIDRGLEGECYVIVFGMHCCGQLSLRALDLCDELCADMAFLMPCCLPPKPKNNNSNGTSSIVSSNSVVMKGSHDQQPEGLQEALEHIYNTTDQLQQYGRWAAHIHTRMQKVFNLSSVVGSAEAEDPVESGIELDENCQNKGNKRVRIHSGQRQDGFCDMREVPDVLSSRRILISGRAPS